MILSGCCCGVDVECPPSECEADFSSAYNVALELKYEWDASGGLGNSCGNPGTCFCSFSGMVVSEASGNCACTGERVPPFIGPKAYLSKGWRVTTSPAPNLRTSEPASPSCLFPCGSAVGSSVPGTWTANAGGFGFGSGPCGTVSALACINEVNEDTGLDVWYWMLALSFTSTATVACWNPSAPVWTVHLALASETRPDCHAPTGLTWTGVPDPTNGTYFRNGRMGRMGISNAITLVPGSGCSCQYPNPGAYSTGGSTEITCNVSIT